MVQTPNITIKIWQFDKYSPGEVWYQTPCIDSDDDDGDDNTNTNIISIIAEELFKQRDNISDCWMMSF